MGILLIAAFILGTSPSQAEPLTITDDLGVTATFGQPVKSIVSLYGAFNEILLALNSASVISARTKNDAHIPQLASLPSIGTHMQPNPELIMAAQPQLLLQIKGRHESGDMTEILRQSGIPVLTFEINSFKQLFDVTRKIGHVIGKKAEAAKLVDNWQTRLDEMRARHKNLPRQKVFYEARYPNLLAAGGAGIVNEIIEAAGGRNVVGVPKKLARMNKEALLASDPDVYIMQKGPMNPAPVPLKERENYSTLRAVDHCLIVDESAFARPGPGSIEAAEYLEKWLNDHAARQK